MHDSLIITLVHHPRFGYLLQPLFASYNSDTEVYTMTESSEAVIRPRLTMEDIETLLG